MPIRSVISVPSKIIIGAFNIRIAFGQPVENFGASNVNIRTIVGDPIGVNYKFFGNKGSRHILCKMPDARVGMSEVSLTGSVDVDGTPEAIDARPVTVRYDTQRIMPAELGEVLYRKNQIVLPIRFDAAVIGLTKKHFRLTAVSGSILRNLKCYLYGSGQAYELVMIPAANRKGVLLVEWTDREMRKENGVMVDVVMRAIEVVGRRV